MTTHSDHIGQSFTEIGAFMEEKLLFEGQRGHFVVVAWVDGVIQCVANTPRDGVIDILGSYIEVIMEDKMQSGAYNSEKVESGT